MNWSQQRKQYKSKDIRLILTNKKQELSNLNTPLKNTHIDHEESNQQNNNNTSSQIKQCVYHFNQPSHVCLSCRKSICLRCAITYCQQHIIHTEDDLLPTLKYNLIENHVQPKEQELQIRLRQSNQRKQFLKNKINKMNEQIEQHFVQVIKILEKKKIQIQKYYQNIFEFYLEEYNQYDIDIKNKISYMNHIRNNTHMFNNIEEIDSIVEEVNQCTNNLEKLEKKFNKNILGKDKIKIEKIWSQRWLQKVLYQIQNIPYKIQLNEQNNNKKKRVITENSDNKLNPFSGVLKNSTSNSRIPSGRIKSIDVHKNL